MHKLITILAVIPSLMYADFDEIPDSHVVAATIILEAGGEKDPRALFAVYEVIRNRSEKRSLSTREVVLQRKQFSCWNNVDRRMALFRKAKAHSRFAEALAIVKNKHLGNTNYTRGADHYHANFVSPYWAASMNHTVTIGNHLFYR